MGNNLANAMEAHYQTFIVCPCPLFVRRY